MPKKAKRKYTKSTPPPDRQCQEPKESGGICGRWTVKGTDRCWNHSEKATAARKRGGKVTADKYRDILETGKRWPIGKNWNKRIEFLQGMFGKVAEGTLKRKVKRKGVEVEVPLDDVDKQYLMAMWDGKIQRAMESRDKTKGFGTEIHVHLKPPRDVEVERDHERN